MLKHPQLSLTLYAKYQDPNLSCSSDILFTRLFLYKMCMSKKRGKTQKFMKYAQKLISSSTPWFKPACQILGSMLIWFCRYFVHKLVHIQNACVRKRGITQRKTDGKDSKVNQDPSQRGSSGIFFTRLIHI